MEPPPSKVPLGVSIYRMDKRSITFNCRLIFIKFSYITRFTLKAALLDYIKSCIRFTLKAALDFTLKFR